MKPAKLSQKISQGRKHTRKHFLHESVGAITNIECVQALNIVNCVETGESIQLAPMDGLVTCLVESINLLEMI